MQDWDETDRGTGLEEKSVSLSLPRDESGLRKLAAEINGAFDAVGAGGRSRYRAELVSEEILTNLVKYGGAGGGIVEMQVIQAPTELRLEVLDETPPYNPESSEPEPLGSNPARDGGLGLMLVRRSCDALYYDYAEDGRNRLIAVFRRDAVEDQIDAGKPIAGGDEQP